MIINWIVNKIKPITVVAVEVRFGIQNVGITTEFYKLDEVSSLQCWDANSRAYPQLGVAEKTQRMWFWKTKKFKNRCKIASEEAKKRKINLRKGTNEKIE